MSLTLKQIANQALLLSSVDEVEQFVGEGTAEVERVVAHANMAITYLKQWGWQTMRKRHEFTLSAAPDGQLYSEEDLPDDFLAFIPDTMYSDNNLWPADFPAGNGLWAYLNSAAGGSGVTYHMRLMADKLQVYQPDVGQTVSFEYMTKYPVQATGAGELKETFTADTDTFRLDDYLLIHELQWRFEKATGNGDWLATKAESDEYRWLKFGDDEGSQSFYPTEGDQVGYGEPYYNPIRPVPNN